MSNTETSGPFYPYAFLTEQNSTRVKFNDGTYARQTKDENGGRYTYYGNGRVSYKDANGQVTMGTYSKSDPKAPWTNPLG